MTLFSLKNKLIKSAHEDGRPLSSTEAEEHVAEIEETIQGAEAALKIAEAGMKKRTHPAQT